MALPAGLRRKIEFFPSGRARDRRRVAWLYRYLETGDGAQAARDVGFPEGSAANAAWHMRMEYSAIIVEAVKYYGATVLPLAVAVLSRAMRAYDPDARIVVVKEMRDGTVLRYTDADPARSSAQVAMAAVKAAAELMDRCGMPKSTTVEFKPDEAGIPGADDFRLLIDRMVGMAGLDAVRRMPWVMTHREYRDYVVGKYGEIEDVTPVGLSGAGIKVLE